MFEDSKGLDEVRSQGLDGVWSAAHDKTVRMLRHNHRHRDAFVALLSEVRHFDAWHWHRDAEYNLLFHSVLEKNRLGFNLLLEAGADPAAQNANGTNVCNPAAISIKLTFIKR